MEFESAAPERVISIPAPYVRENGRCSDAQPDVAYAYDFFFPLMGERSPFYPDARSWGSVIRSATPDPYMYFFQVLLLMTEFHDYGSSRPKVTLQEHPDVYWKTVAMVATAKTPTQRKAVDELLKTDALCDPAYVGHVRRAREMISQLQNDKDDDEGEDDALDEEEGGAPKRRRTKKKKQQNAAAPPPPPRPAVDWSPYAIVDLCLPGFESDGSAVEMTIHGLPATELMWMHAQGQRVAAQVVALPDAAAPGGKKKGTLIMRLRSALEAEYGPDARSQPDTTVQKVRFTVTAVPNDAGLIVGLYARFLIRDEEMNPSEFYVRLVDNQNKRAVRKRNPRSQMAARDAEMFPQYGRFIRIGSSHPVADASAQTYMMRVITIDPSLNTPERIARCGSFGFAHYSDPAHLSAILTTERAVQRMRKMGPSIDIETAPDAWFKDGTALFPPREVASTYVYHSDSLFWYSETYVGFCEQWFPHIKDDSDLIAKILGGRDLKTLAEGVDSPDDERVAQGVYEMLRDYISKHWIVTKKQVIQSTLVPYETYNDFVYRFYEQRLVNRYLGALFPAHAETTFAHVQQMRSAPGVEDWRAAVANPGLVDQLVMQRPNDYRLRSLEFGEIPYAQILERLSADAPLAVRVKEYETYVAIRRRAREAMNSSFVHLWQVTGNTDELSIPPPIKAMLEWYKLNSARLPHMTREFRLEDPELGIFGNATMLRCQNVARIGTVIQPMVAMLGEGAYSCYHFTPHKLGFNQMVHSGPGHGKSWTSIQFLKAMSIPGTIISFTSQTAAASSTKRHFYDEVRTSDEAPAWKVVAAEATKGQNQALIDEAKTALTERQVARLVYVNLTDKNTGDSQRWCQVITTDHMTTSIEASNFHLDPRSPLGSRYYSFTMAAATISPHDLIKAQTTILEKDMPFHFQIGQFLVAAAYKCIQTGGMCEPDMHLFDVLSSRIIGSLCGERAIDNDLVTRRLDVMRPFAIQCVVRNAVTCCYDMPGGENYNRPFRASEVCNMEPYLYCTVEIVVWTWTLLSTSFVEEKNSNVIEACIRAAGQEWSANSSPYALFESDLEREIPWRKRVNQHVQVRKQNDKSTGDEWLLDLNYIKLEGSIEAICQRIADATEPRINASDVLGILESLKSRMIEVPHGGALLPQPQATFEAWHKFTKLPADGNPGVKSVDSNGSLMPMMYRKNNADPSQPRTRNDVPRMPVGTRLPVVDFSEIRNNRLYVMPWVANLFRREKIVNAIKAAIMCKSTRPGKYLLGIEDPHNSTLAQVMRMTESEIRHVVATHDAQSGWDPLTGEWKGDPNVAMNARPTPLSAGVAVKTRNVIVDAEKSLFLTPLIPLAAGEREKWKEKARRGINSMSRSVYVYDDLDERAALRHHLSSGRPLDAPVLSPAYIVNRMRDSCAELGLPFCGESNYPYSMAMEHEANNEVYDRVESDTTRLYRTIVDMSRNNQDEQQLAARRQERQRKRAAAGEVAVPQAPRQRPRPPVFVPQSSERARVTGASDLIDDALR